MENSEINYIKKYYGEKFAHLCRDLFPTILEDQGELTRIITSKFAPTHSIYDVIIKNDKTQEFRAFVYSFAKSIKQKRIQTNKTPKELMEEAGYILYPECKSDKEINEFKKYYFEYEELCTFDSKRLQTCRVWFAVKKNVDSIHRLDFKNPKRQDEYGTSVISIQFTRGKNSSLSIKNRYNHTVHNPDATFGNDLDRIIPGLSDAFIKTYKIDYTNNSSSKFSLQNFTLANDGKFYKFNLRLGETFFCENNVMIKNNEPIIFDKFQSCLVENYLIDFKNKKIMNVFNNKKDEFIKSIGKIENIKISKDSEKNKIIDLLNKKGEVVKLIVNKKNQLIGYENKNIIKINNNFLSFNKCLQKLDLPNVSEIGNGVLSQNVYLEECNIPNIKRIGSRFLYCNLKLKIFKAPYLGKIDNCMLSYNSLLNEIFIPNVKSIGNCFLMSNLELKEFQADKLESVGEMFLQANENIEILSLNNLKIALKSFMSNNKNIKEVNLQNLTFAGDNFFMTNPFIEKVNLPKLEEIGSMFMYHDVNLKSINIPRVKKIGDYFLGKNMTTITELNLPSVTEIGDNFLKNNFVLNKLNIPNLEKTGTCFLNNNNVMTSFNAPKLKEVGSYFLEENKVLSSFTAPNIKKIGSCFLKNNSNFNFEKFYNSLKKKKQNEGLSR